VDVSPLSIEGSWVFTPTIHEDERGSFLEWFRADVFEEAVGHPFTIAQANSSVSTAGTIRGIHFAELPPSQAKYVTCTGGAVFDVVLDIRVGSPTYGQWDAVRLDATTRRVVYLSEGLGHAFMALEDGSIVNYLCSAPYAPDREHGIDPLDAAIAVEWPTTSDDGRPVRHRLSEKDGAAPSLEEARTAGLLPDFSAAQHWRRGLRTGGQQLSE
jgi:dTDP-4-dehydrorhamnose 3,5-epimerase